MRQYKVVISFEFCVLWWIFRFIKFFLIGGSHITTNIFIRSIPRRINFCFTLFNNNNICLFRIKKILNINLERKQSTKSFKKKNHKKNLKGIFFKHLKINKNKYKQSFLKDFYWHDQHHYNQDLLLVWLISPHHHRFVLAWPSPLKCHRCTM